MHAWSSNFMCSIFNIHPLQVRCYFMHVQPLILTTDIVIDQDLPGGGGGGGGGGVGGNYPPLAPH